MRRESSESATLSGRLCTSSTGKRGASSPAKGEPRRKLIRYREPRAFFPASSASAVKTQSSETVPGDGGGDRVEEIASPDRIVTIIPPAITSAEPSYLGDESAVDRPELPERGEAVTGNAVELSGILANPSIDSSGNEAVFDGRGEAMALSDPRPGLVTGEGDEELGGGSATGSGELPPGSVGESGAVIPSLGILTSLMDHKRGRNSERGECGFGNSINDGPANSGRPVK